MGQADRYYDGGDYIEDDPDEITDYDEHGDECRCPQCDPDFHNDRIRDDAWFDEGALS